MAGLFLDPWQQWVVEKVLAEKPEGWYYNEILDKMMRRSSAYEIALIVARQNGKGSIMEALELAWLYILGAKVICHSAHEFATSKEHFQRIESLISGTDELKGELARGGIKWSHGDESVTLVSGQRLIFKTRTKGAARGFSIDKLVMDEAMILKKEMVGAMLPATAARPDVQIMYAGSAGDRESEHFGRARDRGIAGSDPRLLFAEWSANGHNVMCYKGCTDHDDRGSLLAWAKANPGLGIRLEEENIRSEFTGMDPDVFNQERLSIGDWPVEGEAWRIIGKDPWMARTDPLSKIQGQYTFSVDTTPDRRYSCIAVAGDNGEGKTHVEITGNADDILDYRPGTNWVVPRIKQLADRYRNSTFVIDKGTQAVTYVDELEKAHVKMIHPLMREHAGACGDFYSAVIPQKDGPPPYLVHMAQADLNTAVANADKRDIADLWAWDKRNPAADICPLVAATNAFWGHKRLSHKKRPKPMAAWGA
jgi:hypothetical protein